MTASELVLSYGLVTVLSIVKTAILLVGGYIAITSYRAYQRTGDRGLYFLSIGFGMVTIGTFLAGASYNLGLDLVEGILIEGILVLIGLSVIAYSMYVTPNRSAGDRD